MQTIYLVNLLLPYIYVLLLKFFRIKKEKRNVILAVLYSIQFTLIVGTRSLDTGADTGVYFRFYQAIGISGADFSAVSRFEPLFSLTALICSRLGLSYTVFNIIIAGATIIFFSKAILNSSSDVLLSYFLYITFCQFYNAMNQVRQALALTIILYAVTLLRDNNRKKFVFWVIIASLFHYSAVVAFIFLILKDIDLNKKIVFTYIISGIICYILSPYIFRLLSMMPYYGVYFRLHIERSAYIDALMNLLVRAVMLIFTLFFLNEFKDKMKIYYHMALLCTFFQILTALNTGIGRITTYFFMGYMILIPEIVAKSKLFKKSRVLVYILLIAVMLLYHYIYVNAKYDGEYHSILL